MFEPMYTGDPFIRDILHIAPLAIGMVGFLIGLYWIYRITKDIEDNKRV